jgi:hypothetical protein
MVFENDSVSNGDEITKFFKKELENLVITISEKKKWKIEELTNIIDIKYKIKLKNLSQNNKRKLVLLPREQRCIAVLEKNGKNIQCTRKRPKCGKLCGLHISKTLKNGTIYDYNPNEIHLNDNMLNSCIHFSLNLSNEPDSNLNNTINEKNELYNLDYIENLDYKLNSYNYNPSWDTLLVNNCEYYLDTLNNKIYFNDDDNMEEIGYYNNISNIVECY